jgi:uncharacterized UBP type Zn finger protein
MCTHLKKLVGPRSMPVTPSAHGCEDCLATGGTWVHLRLCMTCGHVGCCDSSPNHHATKHHERTGHPVVKSFEPGEGWAWCYTDEEMAEEIRAFPVEIATHHYAPGHAGA